MHSLYCKLQACILLWGRQTLHTREWVGAAKYRWEGKKINRLSWFYHTALLFFLLQQSRQFDCLSGIAAGQHLLYLFCTQRVTNASKLGRGTTPTAGLIDSYVCRVPVHVIFGTWGAKHVSLQLHIRCFIWLNSHCTCMKFAHAHSQPQFVGHTSSTPLWTAQACSQDIDINRFGIGRL